MPASSSTKNSTVVDTRSFEARIEKLVLSNENKIVRLKQVITENNSMRGQIETLHRMNKSLAETVDAFRGNENTAPPDQSKLDGVMQVIEDRDQRIKRLNEINFELKAENLKLKNCLITHSKSILREHNYHL